MLNMKPKSNHILLLFLFSLLIQSSICATDSDCTNVSPAVKTDCTDLEIGTGKKCCFFSFGSSTTTKCSPIPINTYETLMTGIEGYKSKLSDSTNFISDCNTLMEVCAKIINPQKDLACTGRKSEEPYACCFIKDEKEAKSCLPIDPTELQTIINYAKSYKEKNGQNKEPEVICGGNKVELMGISMIMMVITWLGIIYI